MKSADKHKDNPIITKDKLKIMEIVSEAKCIENLRFRKRSQVFKVNAINAAKIIVFHKEQSIRFMIFLFIKTKLSKFTFIP